ncbi:DUF4278 domain-containing protein [Spirulina sp. 06S082]|uniref:DUF4278 domain-containing protein n=1 Tax=Spirulina sp. 06S082 TaxID=3110248 RepID=UPI002B214A3B|nr:DUF4278 domain-containing protein [Spirulina sp. 06S082]MEA5470831.1 DUF4278 domain-containing protein [Spirulina sp. 06S082]
MKLFYRGHSYTAHTHIIPATDVTVEGKYRGANITWHNKQARVKHSDQLTYRGVRHTGG